MKFSDLLPFQSVDLQLFYDWYTIGHKRVKLKILVHYTSILPIDIGIYLTESIFSLK